MTERGSPLWIPWILNVTANSYARTPGEHKRSSGYFGPWKNVWCKYYNLLTRLSKLNLNVLHRGQSKASGNRKYADRPTNRQQIIACRNAVAMCPTQPSTSNLVGSLRPRKRALCD